MTKYYLKYEEEGVMPENYWIPFIIFSPVFLLIYSMYAKEVFNFNLINGIAYYIILELLLFLFLRLVAWLDKRTKRKYYVEIKK